MHISTKIHYGHLLAAMLDTPHDTSWTESTTIKPCVGCMRDVNISSLGWRAVYRCLGLLRSRGACGLRALKRDPLVQHLQHSLSLPR